MYLFGITMRFAFDMVGRQFYTSTETFAVIMIDYCVRNETIQFINFACVLGPSGAM